MKKNEIYDLEILDNGINFEGISKLDNMTVFIPECIIGEKVNAKIVKVNTSYCFALVNKIIEKSTYRKEAVCEVYNRCGGCACQHIDYDFTLDLKAKIVANALKKQGVSVEKMESCIGMGLPYYYRNKVQYPVGIDRKGNTILGFYAKRSHDIVENNCCYIQDRIIDMLSKEIFRILLENNFEGYNEEKLSGDIRHIMIRRGYHTSEIMVVLVVNNKKIVNDARMKKVISLIRNINDNIQSVFININDQNTNEILGQKTVCVYGDEYISDYIDEYKYLISPKSFFQVNTSQTEILYNTLSEKLELDENDVLFDLYSGVGTIGIFLSKYVNKVYGIEIEEEAVKMANMNLELNNIHNAEYIAGGVEDKIEEFKDRNIHPSVIVVDPPRKGLDEKSIEYILEFGPEKIGYVSCNPATLARDLKRLSEKYDIVSITPVDMFPQTVHVETVTILRKSIRI